MDIYYYQNSFIIVILITNCESILTSNFIFLVLHVKCANTQNILLFDGYIYMYYYQNSFITCIVFLNTNCDCCENCHLLTSRAQLEFYVRLL